MKLLLSHKPGLLFTFLLIFTLLTIDVFGQSKVRQQDPFQQSSVNPVSISSITLDVPDGRPNILVIVADDLGYADVGFQGSLEIPTPHLDSLAEKGLRCTNGYVSHSVCSPSRAGLLTGRHQMRFGHDTNVRDRQGSSDGLPVTERLLSQLLAQAGYATGWIGKWHLGSMPQFQPQNRGFQETFGFLAGGHNYINWQVTPGKTYFEPIVRNGKPVGVKEHLTLAFGREAGAFIRRNHNQPWFLYLAFNAPHTPHQPTAERLKKFSHIKNELRRAYVAQVSLLDDAVGETLAVLHKTGQERRTLIFFFSDNGGPTADYGGNCANNAPLRGKKGMLYEGGVHVPFLVSWPDRLPAGKDYDLPVSSLDVFATSLACAGIPMPLDRDYDGVNLVPFLSGKKPDAPHKCLFWRQNFNGVDEWAMRQGNIKYLRRSHDLPGNPEGKPRPKPKRMNVPVEELFDLSTDISENDNLNAYRLEELRQMGAAVVEWNKLGSPPAFRFDTIGEELPFKMDRNRQND